MQSTAQIVAAYLTEAPPEQNDFAVFRSIFEVMAAGKRAAC